MTNSTGLNTEANLTGCRVRHCALDKLQRTRTRNFNCFICRAHTVHLDVSTEVGEILEPKSQPKLKTFCDTNRSPGYRHNVGARYLLFDAPFISLKSQA